MRYIATYVIYIATLIRALTQWARGDPPFQPLVMGLLLAYGVLMVVEPRLTRRYPRFPVIYLVIQFALTMPSLMIGAPLDFLPSLFLPLAFQAVLFFGWRIGFVITGLFTIARLGPLLVEGEPPIFNLAMMISFGMLAFLVASYGFLIVRAEQRRQENQRLLAELEVANGQLAAYAAQAKELAAEQERSRMARELHDSVTQTIFSMNLAVQSARLLAGKDMQQIPAQLDRIQELARSASGEIGVLVEQLKPKQLAADGFLGALEQLASEREQRDGLKVCLEIVGERDLPAPESSGLFRIIQEALNNVTRHSGVTEAFVRVNLSAIPAFVEIEDQGAGFVPLAAPRAGHLGLSSMAQRAREIGWRLEIDSQPGRGTKIRLVESTIRGE